MARKSWSEALGDDDDLVDQFEHTEAAAEDGDPVPAGDYVGVVDEIYVDKSKNTGTPCVTTVFTISEGEFAKRKVWNSVWLTKKNLSRAKRDLLKFKIESLRPDAIEAADSLIYTVEFRVVQRASEDGQHVNNEIRRFKVTDVKAKDFGDDDVEFPADKALAEPAPAEKGDAYEEFVGEELA